MPRIVPAMLCFALAAPLAAETDRQPLEERLRETGSRLALTDQQAAEVRPILQNHFAAQAALLEEYDRAGSDQVDAGRFQALRRDLDANRAETARKLAAILSAEQMAEFETIQAERQAQVRKRFLAKRVAEIRSRLDLGEQQIAEAGPILQSHFEGQLALMDEHDLDRSGPFDADQFRALRQDLEANKARTAEQLAAILTAEQIAEFDTLQAEGQQRIRKRVIARRMDQIGARLDLTEEQTTAVRPILQDHFDGQLALLEQHGIDSGERPKIRKLRALRRDLDAKEKETAEKLAAILSSEQMAEYNKIQDEQRERRKRTRRSDP